jgi:hypothetical protein
MRGVGFDRLPPPPRHVPLALRLALWLGGVRQLACAFVAIGAPFAWFVTAHADWRRALFVGHTLATMPATVTAVEATPLKESHDGAQAVVRRVSFQFGAAIGTGFAGVSWGPTSLEVGDTTRVEFPDGRPELARVVGMRGAPLEALAALLPLAYALPLFVALGGSARLKRQARLLERGRYVLARLEDGEYWQDPAGRRRRLSGRPINLPDGTPLPLLYDPSRPAEAEAVTRFSWLVTIAADGRLVPPRPVVPLWLLVLPLVALLANVASIPLAGALR